MDIANYINSSDIREHIRNVGNPFTSIEAAWLIWQCRHITLAQRHEAWRELIRTMPDEKIERRIWTREWPSLHGYLEKLIAFENRLVEAFFQTMPQTFYRCEIWLPSRLDSEEDDDYYPDYESCKQFIADVYEDYFKWDDADQIRFKIRKCWIRRDAPEMIVEFNAKWEMISIWQQGIVVEDICAELDDFAGMWFDFPTPFKKGDILIGSSIDLAWCRSDVFVLDWVITNDRELVKKRKDGWDSMDMVAIGYFQEGDGRVYHECMHDYMNLQYYHGELMGIKRILKALSSFQKGEVELDLFINAYHTILTEEQFKRIYPKYYTEEGMKLVGLEKREDLE